MPIPPSVVVALLEMSDVGTVPISPSKAFYQAATDRMLTSVKASIVAVPFAGLVAVPAGGPMKGAAVGTLSPLTPPAAVVALAIATDVKSTSSASFYTAMVTRIFAAIQAATVAVPATGLIAPVSATPATGGPATGAAVGTIVIAVPAAAVALQIMSDLKLPPTDPSLKFYKAMATEIFTAVTAATVAIPATGIAVATGAVVSGAAVGVIS